MKKTLSILSIATLVSVLTFTSCNNDDDPVYSPKPKGFPRIYFPEKTYRVFDTICPYQFEIPVYTSVSADRHKNAEPCWYNIDFPSFRATLHLSYKEVNKNVSSYIEDSHNFANRHQIKATGLDESVIVRDSAKVYGLMFDIAGNTASSLQFYVTDSSKHFLRGALYFNSVPNVDSLKIVIDYIRKDVLHLINTVKWKDDVRKTD